MWLAEIPEPHNVCGVLRFTRDVIYIVNIQPFNIPPKKSLGSEESQKNAKGKLKLQKSWKYLVLLFKRILTLFRVENVRKRKTNLTY